MTTNPKIYKAVMELAEADSWEVDKVFEELWNDAQARTTSKGKKHFMLASDIAALVRDRLRKPKFKGRCCSCGRIQVLSPQEPSRCNKCGGGMFTNVIGEGDWKK